MDIGALQFKDVAGDQSQLAQERKPILYIKIKKKISQEEHESIYANVRRLVNDTYWTLITHDADCDDAKVLSEKLLTEVDEEIVGEIRAYIETQTKGRF